MEITLEEIQKKFESLPEDIRWAIMAAKVDDTVIDIGQARGLTVEQMGQLSLETHMVMLGFVHPDKFEQSLKGSLKLSDEKNKQIVEDVNEKILKDVREKLMSLYSGEVDETTKPVSPTTPPVAETKIEEEKVDLSNDILKQAGIEIMPDELPSGKTEIPEKKGESILSSKLNNSFKMAGTKTEYSFNNPTEAKNTPTPAEVKTPTPTSPTPKVDPYRMPIE